MNARICLMGAVALALFCLAGSAQATVVFSDDFEGYTDVATTWNDGLDHDPTGAWAVIESAQSGVQVMANPATGAFTTLYGNQYLHSYVSGDCESDVQLTAGAQATIAANGNMQLEIEAYNVSGAKNLGFSAFDSASGVYANRAFDVSLRSDGALWAYQGATTTQIAGAYTLDAWHKYTVDCNFVTDRWSVAVDGATVASNLVFEGGDLSQVQTIAMAASGAGGHGGYDSIVVSSVPEPSAIALLLTGLFGLLAYAWRKRK